MSILQTAAVVDANPDINQTFQLDAGDSHYTVVAAEDLSLLRRGRFKLILEACLGRLKLARE
jgi:hypothetical protein